MTESNMMTQAERKEEDLDIEKQSEVGKKRQ